MESKKLVPHDYTSKNSHNQFGHDFSIIGFKQWSKICFWCLLDREIIFDPSPG